MAWLVLLLIAALAVVVGALVLREEQPLLPDQRPPIGIGPFGPGAPCEISLAEGRLLEYRTADTLLSIDESGAVVEVVDNLFASPNSPPVDRLEVGLSVRQLSMAGLGVVRNRLNALGIAGCHALRADAGGSLVARSLRGIGELSYSNSLGARALVPLASEETTLLLQELDRDLMDLESWLGPEQVTAKQALAPDRWLVMILLSNGEPALDLTNDHTTGLGPFPGSRERTRLLLPAGAAPELFGQSLGEADAWPEVTRRCGTVSTAEADALANSLQGQAQATFPDMWIWIEPAIGPSRDCGQLAHLMGYGEAAQVPGATPAVEGDLAGIDPCMLVPPDLIGPIELSYPVGPPPFGVAARSCLLLETQTMGTITERHVLWVYPWAMPMIEAGSLAHRMFGAGVESDERDGVTTWRNHCLTASVDCTGGLALYHRGRFVLVEVLRPGATSGRLEPAERIMAAVLERLRQMP